MAEIIQDVTNLQKLCLNVIKCGPVPKHVAFILDGNRRYSEKVKITLRESYLLGMTKLFTTMTWCVGLQRHLGIQEITYFVLSLHNLDRNKSEVDNLMKMLHVLCSKFHDNIKYLLKHNIMVKFKGETSLIPDKTKKLLMEVETKTKDCTGIVVNVAACYTSLDEITKAVSKIVNIENIRNQDINEELISKNLYIERDVDLMIRTSGETRLSNFVLWQLSKGFIAFEKNTWAEFSFWNFYKILLRYQLSWNSKPR